ncbi:hypothetical protein H0H92_015963, partial [Tricholoma furcatifolium]
RVVRPHPFLPLLLLLHLMTRKKLWLLLSEALMSSASIVEALVTSPRLARPGSSTSRPSMTNLLVAPRSLVTIRRRRTMHF